MDRNELGGRGSCSTEVRAQIGGAECIVGWGRQKCEIGFRWGGRMGWMGNVGWERQKWRLELGRWSRYRGWLDVVAELVDES